MSTHYTQSFRRTSSGHDLRSSGRCHPAIGKKDLVCIARAVNMRKIRHSNRAIRYFCHSMIGPPYASPCAFAAAIVLRRHSSGLLKMFTSQRCGGLMSMALEIAAHNRRSHSIAHHRTGRNSTPRGLHFNSSSLQRATCTYTTPR
jgi:hypothetical protein